MLVRIFLTFSLAIFLGSCGIIGTEQFGKQKYTNFKRGNGQFIKKQKAEYQRAFKNETLSKEKEPVQIAGTGIVPVISNPAYTDVVGVSEEEQMNSGTSKSTIDRSRKPHTFSMMGKSKSSSGGDGGCNTALMILLCIFLPPVAIYIEESTTTRFWIALVCCIISGGFFFSYYIGGFWLIAMILAFMAVFGN